MLYANCISPKKLLNNNLILTIFRKNGERIDFKPLSKLKNGQQQWTLY